VYFPNTYLAAMPSIDVPAVATFHDFNHKRFDSWNDQMRAQIDRELPRWIDACLPVVSTNFTLSELLSYHPEASGRAGVIPLGVPRVKPAGPPANWQAFASARGLDQPFLMSIGWLSPHKNQAIILEALAGLRRRGVELTMVFVGPNSEGLQGTRWPGDPYVRHMLHLCDKLGLVRGRDVLGLGSVSDAELEMLYLRAGGLVMPTMYEGFGLPPLEAISHGCPVACSDIPPLRETLSAARATATFFDPLDPLSVADALQHASEDAHALRAAAQEAGPRVSALFSLHETARQYLKVFDSLLDAR
jgi:glycosyltransferase involved in cell wall biosynthesis